MDKFLDKIGNQLLGVLILPLIATAVANWFTDTLGLITLQALLAGALLLTFPLVMWVKLRKSMSPWLVVVACVLGELLLLVGASQLTHKAVKLKEGLFGRDDLASRFHGPKVHGDKAKYSYNTIYLVGPPVLAERGNVELHALLSFTWATQTRTLDPICGPRTYLTTLGMVAQSRQSTSGLSYDPFEPEAFSVTPQSSWCAWLFGWLETPTLLSEAGFVTRWSDEQLHNPGP